MWEGVQGVVEVQCGHHKCGGRWRVWLVNVPLLKGEHVLE